jgi:hypothetical protein
LSLLGTGLRTRPSLGKSRASVWDALPAEAGVPSMAGEGDGPAFAEVGDMEAGGRLLC